jgi:hypothetical protein
MSALKTWLTYNPVSYNRIFFICLAVLLTLPNVQASQQENKVMCSAVQPKIDAKPGTTVALSIKVTNATPELQKFNAKLDLPEGWRQVIREFPFEITAGKADFRLVTVSIPSDAPAGRYAIRYSVRDNASPANEADVSIEVNIVSIIQLDVKLLQAPRFSIAGTTFATTILVTNQGNSAGSMNLYCKSSYNFPIRLDSSVINLAPKEVRQVIVYVTPDEKSGKVNHTLEIDARSRQDTTIRVRVSSVVEIIPNTSKVEEEYLLFPVSLRLREVGQDGKFTPQAEVYGYGSLSEKKTDQLEFLFRGPETQLVSTLGLRDEYRISYHRDNLELLAGDQNYSLSTLTEAGRYATGIGGKAQIGALSAGGFYNSTRWTISSQKEIGGFIDYDVLKNAALGINYLRKREEFSSDIMSIRSIIKPISETMLDLEYGSGEKDSKKDDAFAAQLIGNQKWISYNLRYIQAGSNYGGYYRDINFFSSSINLRPMGNLRIETYMRLEDRNLARDTNQIYVPHDVSYQVGAGYADLVSVYYINNFQQDRFDSSKYRTREEAIQTRLGYSFSFANIYANMDLGITRDELHSKESPYKRFSLSTSFSPFSKQNYSTSVEYTTLTDTYTGEKQERLSANLYAWILLGESTQAQFNIYGSRINASVKQTYSMLEASIEHILPFKHKIILRGRHTIITPSIQNNEDAYALEYQIPIGVPFKRITSVGQLRGFMQDEQGRGIANVIVNIGDNKAMTDKSGLFYFGSIKPGTVFLSVDKASIGFDRITDQPMPMELLIKGGEETKLVLKVTRSVTIAGDVILYGTKEKGTLDTTTSIVEIGGRAGVFMEISSSTEMHRRVTDNKGKFIFNDLRPGQWTLKVIGGDIPEYHNIYPDSIRIILLPGERKDTTIQIRPRKRVIRMLEGSQSIPQMTPKFEANLSVPPRPPEIEKKKDTISAITQPHKTCMISYDEKRKGYVLQISSWITKKKAEKVAKYADRIAGLKTFKQAAYIPSIGRRFRVYIGNFKTREEAVDFCYQFDFDL